MMLYNNDELDILDDEPSVIDDDEPDVFDCDDPAGNDHQV